MLLDLSGNRTTLDNYRHRVILVNFWTSWCPPCIKEMPALERLSRAMVGQPFALIAVNVAEGRGIAQRFASLEAAGIALFRDVNGDMATQWGVEVYPTSFIVDGEGRIHETIIGETAWDAQARHDQLNALIRATAKGGTD